MKKLTTLALAAGLIVAAAAPASAVDTKVDGQYLFSFGRAATGFAGQDLELARQRLRLGLTFTASENLSGYVQFQAREAWGTADNIHDNINTVGVTHRMAYINWMVPTTSIKVRMGKFSHGMPGDAFGKNQVMNAGAVRTGIEISTPVTDWMDMGALWSRPVSDDDDATATTSYKTAWAAGYADVDQQNNSDTFGLYANLKFDGITVSPWVLFNTGDDGCFNENRGTDAAITAKADGVTYWGGLSTTLTMFDPLTIKASGAYGLRDYDGFLDRSGWYAQALATYKMDFGTPVFGFWYGSGDENDTEYAFRNWVPVTKGAFTPSTTYHDNAFGLGGGQALGNICGTWGLKLGVQGVSFLEGLTHDFAVIMINGTNHGNMITSGKADSTDTKYLTWSDTVYEFDFGTTYQIYKNLAANLELAYLINDLDDQSTKSEDDWRVALSFKYAF